MKLKLVCSSLLLSMSCLYANGWGPTNGPTNDPLFGHRDAVMSVPQTTKTSVNSANMVGGNDISEFVKDEKQQELINSMQITEKDKQDILNAMTLDKETFDEIAKNASEIDEDFINKIKEESKKFEKMMDEQEAKKEAAEDKESVLTIPRAKTETLKGDEGDSCTAILCLVGGATAPECQKALARYWSIGPDSWKKPWTIVTNRLNFLKICPKKNAAGSSISDSELYKLANVGSCDAEYLNRLEETGSTTAGRYSQKLGLKRVITQKPRECVELERTSLGKGINKVSYSNPACKKNEFYSTIDFQRGYYFTEVSEQIYNNLPQHERAKPVNSWVYNSDGSVKGYKGDWIKIGPSSYGTMEHPICSYNTFAEEYSCKTVTTKFYKKVKIEKRCWQDSKF